jgi:hypothetical protein
MGHTFQSLLDEFCRVRDAEYRDDPEQDAARMDSIEYTIQAMLEMMRDRFDPR